MLALFGTLAYVTDYCFELGIKNVTVEEIIGRVRVSVS